MRELHFTIGPPGCGKTTAALDWMKASPNTRAVVSLDGLRHALFGSKRAFWDNQPDASWRDLVRSTYVDTLYNLALSSTRDIMLPNTNLDEWFHNHAVTIADLFGLKMVYRIFDQVDLNELYYRNTFRPVEDRLRAEVVQDYYNRFNAPDAYWRKLK